MPKWITDFEASAPKGYLNCVCAEKVVQRKLRQQFISVYKKARNKQIVMEQTNTHGTNKYSRNKLNQFDFATRICVDHTFCQSTPRPLSFSSNCGFPTYRS